MRQMENLPLMGRGKNRLSFKGMRETIKLLEEALAGTPDLNEAQLSRAAGRDSSYFQKLKTGKAGDPGVQTLIKLAWRLGIDDSVLLRAVRRDAGIEGDMANRKENLIRMVENMNSEQADEMFSRAAEILKRPSAAKKAVKGGKTQKAGPKGQSLTQGRQTKSA